MGQLAQRDIQALVACVTEISALHELDTFRDHVLHAVSRIVPAELMTYTELGLRAQPTARVMHPAGAVPAGLAQTFESHKHEHPLIWHFSEHPQARVGKISDFLTQREFRRLALYNEFFRKIGVEYQIVIGLPAPSPRVGGVALSRKGPDFSERERMLLSVLQPHIVQAHRNAEAFSRVKREATLVLTGLEEVGRGIVLSGPDGGIRLATQLSRQWLTTYFGRSALRAKRLPDALQRWVESQMTQGASTVFSARRPLVVEREQTRLVVRLLPSRGGNLLLLEQQRTVLMPTSLESLGLSPREAEVLAWVAQGKTDADIGAILRLSPRTVAKHLEHIYNRLGVENRSAAAARAFTAALTAS